MISIKEYLERPQSDVSHDDAINSSGRKPANSNEESAAAASRTVETESNGQLEQVDKELLPAAVAAYRSALVEMGNCGQDACPALAEELKRSLNKLGGRLTAEITRQKIEETASGVRGELQGWGRHTALHYRQKTSEVKEMLLVMAHAAESIGERDQQCAAQFTAVTTRLKGIANLEDLTEIRESIKKSASDLKSSIDRMTAEGKAALDGLRAEVSSYQQRLEEAEEIASRDALTGLHNRLWAEGQIERSLHGRAPFCVAIIDLDGFKLVNDAHGHLVGDELLKKFAAKIKSVCRVTDTIGRWGGDEFILLQHCGIKEAAAQIDRLREWVCVNYTIQGSAGSIKLRVSASIGLTEGTPGESMKALLDRADAAMYREKAATREAKANQSA
ncbi:MAG: GGDEF domain-containing protein [Terracidiphilus sp.]|jgi:diguanylate cyclase